MKYLFFCITSFFLSAISIQAQNLSLKDPEWDYFFSLNCGSQMSGIKDEDFVSSNYAPLFNITAGKWFAQYLAFQIGYKGFYFYYIADEIRHHYDYFYGEAVVNVNNIVQPKRSNKNWSVLLHGGAGYFYNHVYGKPSICTNIGIMNNYQLTNQFQVTIDISSIIGWDIYQGNEDILPGMIVGVTYFFNMGK